MQAARLDHRERGGAIGDAFAAHRLRIHAGMRQHQVQGRFHRTAKRSQPDDLAGQFASVRDRRTLGGDYDKG
ncbi:hypothetical protein D3C78_1899850 [compost metagenome]